MATIKNQAADGVKKRRGRKPKDQAGTAGGGIGDLATPDLEGLEGRPGAPPELREIDWDDEDREQDEAEGSRFDAEMAILDALDVDWEAPLEHSVEDILLILDSHDPNHDEDDLAA